MMIVSDDFDNDYIESDFIDQKLIIIYFTTHLFIIAQTLISLSDKWHAGFQLGLDILYRY